MPPLMYDEQEVKTTIDKIVNRTFAMDFTWDWPAGVAFYGVSRAHEATGNESYLQALAAWVDAQLEEGLPKLTVNAVSIGHSLIHLYNATQKDIYLETAVLMADFLRHDAPRFADGIFQHTVSQNYNFPEQAWVDTMFMAGYFLVRMGTLLGRADYLEDGLLQYHGHERFLQDPESNLYYHGWDHIAQNNMSAMFWARGNSWAAYTMAMALKDVEVTHPSFMKIHDSLRDQLSSLVRLQAADGLWHTLLQDASSYTETSGSAGIAAALVRFNEAIGSPLYNKAIQPAIAGVLGKVTAAGAVTSVSAGTAVMKDADGYRNVPNQRVQGWGQGLALVFLSSLLTYRLK
ncbi:glycoside hydrolase family 88 protein [Paenibacillus allorhizosphaerae]|uniref:Unsaturated rhamnogalacturonyl hydrolase YesR n=1 Tax=Paenibacillus allorhizosphaerae TaxID=2849866 RepID=A0ABN7TJE7_9BACL|nr:glycoside hydrolase family 88 protein [Paenibacillus allorhizosphaerae]CAG7638060.1 Unsaturated rhamnogalacturonyl hydrolase YesR [Paenibacillus allorhizosphaerae]